MIPTCLHGHERAITKIIYNRDGDLLFTAAKNPTSCVWFAVNGERLGTFEGHSGTVWCIDADYTSSKFLSASADCSIKLWDISNGKELNSICGSSPFRTCAFSYCGNLFFWATASVMKQACELVVVDSRDAAQMAGKGHVMRKECPDKETITQAVWGPLDRSIICGYEDGSLESVDARTGESVTRVKPHKGLITDIQMYHDSTMFITSSKDHSAMLFDAYDLQCLRTYTTERPVNSASISPTQNHVLLGGGQEAKDVTTTAVSSGKFDTKLYHMIHEEEFGRIKGHFGPVNSVQFNRDGTGFSTGGEDGYVRIHVFDDDYYELDNKLF